MKLPHALVLYTHKLVRDRLVAAGLITENGGSYYMDMQQFAQAIIDGKAGPTWKQAELYGSLSVKTTDPTKSNSGNTCGLVAKRRAGGRCRESGFDPPELTFFSGWLYGYISADLFTVSEDGRGRVSHDCCL